MFAEHKEAGEITRTMKLSQAIRMGLSIVQEDQRNWRCCALGAAFAGIHGRLMTCKESESFISDVYCRDKYHLTSHAIAANIGFSAELCEEVNRKHYLGMPAAQIADWLEAR